MAESLTTEHAYLSVSNFPVLVLTEAGALSDSERTTIIEYLEALLDGGEKHTLIIDLSEGEALPETQRIYVADALQMNAKAIVKSWGGLAIVVGGQEPDQLAKAEFWLGISPVPAQAFPTLDAAMVWARGTLGLPPETPQVPNEAERASRASRVTARNKIADRAEEPVSVKGKIAKTGAERFLERLTSTVGLTAVAAVVAAVVLFVMSPPSEGQMSSADKRTFERAKADLGLRITRQKDGHTQNLKRGEKCAAGDKVSFSVDYPANGFAALVNVKANGSIVPVAPKDLAQQAGQVMAGKDVHLPVILTLDASAGKESFVVLYCSSGFAPQSCKASTAGVQCPPGCVTREFPIEK